MKEIDAVRLLDKASASFFLHFSLVSYPNSRQVFLRLISLLRNTMTPQEESFGNIDFFFPIFLNSLKLINDLVF